MTPKQRRIVGNIELFIALILVGALIPLWAVPALMLRSAVRVAMELKRERG